MYKHNLGLEEASALSVIIAQLWTLKVIANSKLGVSSQNFALHFAIALHFAFALLLAIAVMIRSS